MINLTQTSVLFVHRLCIQTACYKDQPVTVILLF